MAAKTQGLKLPAGYYKKLVDEWSEKNMETDWMYALGRPTVYDPRQFMPSSIERETTEQHVRNWLEDCYLFETQKLSTETADPSRWGVGVSRWKDVR